MNRIVLVGRLESTPDLRHTSTGIPVANFSLSVRRSIPNGQGRYERDIFRIVTWRKLAETCCRFLERGRMIAVDGKLQNRVLQSPNGDRRIIVEIHADDVRFLEGAKPRSENNDKQHKEDEPRETESASGTAMDEVGSSEDKESNDDDGFSLELSSVTEVSEEANKSDENWFTDEDAGTPIDL